MADRRLWQAALALAALFAISAFSVHAEDDLRPPGPFPVPESIKGNVGFWVRVFSEWSVSQVAIHDLEHPALLFEVVELPGEIQGRYTDEQEKFVEDIRESWESFLYHLEKKTAGGRPLNEIEQEWSGHIATAVGPDGLTGAHDRVRSQRGLRERFRDGLERSFRYEPLIREIFREAGLPEDLAYLPHVESSFQYHARSSAGATGLWQFTRGTGKRYMTIDSTIDERLDPIAATRGAAGYLSEAYEKLGTWPLALTSYNHGVQGMLRATGRHGTDFNRIYEDYDGRLFGFASKNFYAEFLAARTIASEPERFFPEGYVPEPFFDLDQIVLDRRMSPGGIASHLGIALDELVSLNPAWSSRAVKKGLALPAGTVVWLPKGSAAREASSGRAQPAAARGSVDDGGLYVVRKGDTLAAIAHTYGLSVDRLRELNGITSGSSLIRVGDRLRLRSGPITRPYTVRPGDTLSEIAQSHGIGLRDLRELNEISPDSSKIRVGQKLRVPAAARRDAEHIVRRGETLLRIASVHGVRLTTLLSANTLTIHSIIHPGQTLRIPAP